jgi:hypothetical protein
MAENKWENRFPNISETVEKKGLKLSFIAGQAGLKYDSLYARLAGRTDFELPVMKKISRVLGESMDYLFGDIKKISA